MLKGRRIVLPKGIRPTQDKVRKALFDILGDLSGLSFLELFAGSGAIGLEAISRGAAEAVLVELNPASCEAIRKNIRQMQTESCSLLSGEAAKAIRGLSQAKHRFDIIFLDPPYYQQEAKKTLQTISACDILAPNGLIIAQHFKKDCLPDKLGVLSLFRQSRYGDTVLSFYRKSVPIEG